MSSELVVISAIHLAAQFEKYCVSHRDSAEELLEQLFDVLGEAVSDTLTQPQATAYIFLREYFKHRGDWRAMERCMTELACEKLSVDSAKLNALLREAPEIFK